MSSRRPTQRVIFSTWKRLILIDMCEKAEEDAKEAGKAKQDRETSNEVASRNFEQIEGVNLDFSVTDQDGSAAVNEDLWIPRNPPLKLRTKIQIPQDVTISSLLNPNGKWKINEVISWFHQDDIPWVLGIKPSMHQSDWITWHSTPNGRRCLSRPLAVPEVIKNLEHKALNDHMWITWAQDLLELHLGKNQNSPQIKAPKPNLLRQPPPPNSFLINTDASLVEGQPGYSLSAVIRDSEGSLVVAETEFILGCSSVLLAEAAAILLGINLAIIRSLLNVQVASDCKTIIQALRLKTKNTQIGIVIMWLIVKLSGAVWPKKKRYKLYESLDSSLWLLVPSVVQPGPQDSFVPLPDSHLTEIPLFLYVPFNFFKHNKWIGSLRIFLLRDFNILH
ncbi:hypothetical protein G4B88_000664 [Cannabis sativa]|uniref:RNase H type-1 domain-containing protein n=1 Tax=Cannabis sativa TaxID=3483 RepID=A0A7J6HFR7_CANSA|nr:hypothetical protein G4B88_000664 [Cannabis sativa]